MRVFALSGCPMKSTFNACVTDSDVSLETVRVFKDSRPSSSSPPEKSLRLSGPGRAGGRCCPAAPAASAPPEESYNERLREAALAIGEIV